MKIGVFDPYLDDGGGGEKYMMTIAEFLSVDNDVSVFWDNKADLDLVERRFNLDLSRINLKKNIFKKSTFEKMKETTSYDVIIFHSDGSIPLSLSKKLFLHIQRPIDNFGRDLVSKVKLARVNKVFCNSEYTKRFIDKSSGLNTVVITPPVQIKKKELKKENIILHVGRFRIVEKTLDDVFDFKKQNMMIESFKKLSPKAKDWKFVLAVSIKDSDREAFEIIKKKTKGEKIEFLVNETNDNLWNLYSRSKIYWHASGFGEDLDKNPEMAEHFGISTVEAMGGGCVPVVINAGGQREIINDKVNGFLWNSQDELIKKTLDLIRDNNMLQEMSENSQKSALAYSKEAFCKRIDTLINS